MYEALEKDIHRYTLYHVPEEGYHRQIRKVTKTMCAFTSDMELPKLVYLANRNIEKKWTSALQFEQ